MTYSLDSLNGGSRPGVAARESGGTRFATEVSLLVGVFLLGFWLLALLTYSPLDSAWSTSGDGSVLRNL